MKHIFSTFHKTRTIQLLLFGCIALMAFHTTVKAENNNEQSIRVSPVIIPLSLQPGTTKVENIQVQNLTDQPIALQAVIEGFDTEDTTETVLPSTLSNPLMEWIHLPTKDMLLDPHAQTTLPITITIPSQVPVGGYYAAIYITPLPRTKNKSTFAIIPKIGVLILGSLGVTPESLQKSINIASFSMPSIYFDSQPIPWSILGRNTGLAHASTTAFLELTDAIANQLIRHNGGEKIVFPGKTRSFSGSISLPIKPSLYKVKTYLSVSGSPSDIREQYLLVLPKQELGIAIVAFVVALILFSVGKRIPKALVILFKGRE